MSFFSGLTGGGWGATGTATASGVGSNINWGSLLNTGLQAYGAYQGSKGTTAPTSTATAGGTSSVYGDLFKGILSGVGASAAAKGDLEMAREVTKLKGLEDRKSTAFEAELLDFYKQRDNYNKFRALDQYGQFSRVSKFAPQYQRTYAGPTNPGTTAPVPKA